MYRKKPIKEMSKGIIRTWDILGPFNLETLIYQGKVKYEDNGIEQIQKS
jgi:hypothetical protein